jgi:hypothetical protein
VGTLVYFDGKVSGVFKQDIGFRADIVTLSHSKKYTSALFS